MSPPRGIVSKTSAHRVPGWPFSRCSVRRPNVELRPSASRSKVHTLVFGSIKSHSFLCERRGTTGESDAAGESAAAAEATCKVTYWRDRVNRILEVGVSDGIGKATVTESPSCVQEKGGGFRRSGAVPTASLWGCEVVALSGGACSDGDVSPIISPSCAIMTGEPEPIAKRCRAAS